MTTFMNMGLMVLATFATAMVVVHVFLAVVYRRNRFHPFQTPALRLPGYSLSRRVESLTSDLMVYVVAYCAMVPFMVWHVLRSEAWVSGLAVVIVTAVIVGRWIFGLFDTCRNAKLGLQGEVYVGQELNMLMRKQATVYHDIPYERGNIDHVVIGHDVIYAVETKAVRKPVRQGTKAQKDARVTVTATGLQYPTFFDTKAFEQARAHARHLNADIRKNTGVSVNVVPVVALPGWFVQQSKETKSDVKVVSVNGVKWFSGRLGTPGAMPERGAVVAYLESRAREGYPNEDGRERSEGRITDPTGSSYLANLIKRKTNRKTQWAKS